MQSPQMENFVVSARKYRPAVFRSVIGQEHITSTLKNAISRDQLAHAYLFCGPRGVGKTTCARIFAKSINCLRPIDNEACGECESCKAFNEERSFNIHELDAASNNSVDDIRTLTEQVRIPPQIGRYSVYIIDEVHMLSASAFNAFLKTLEEPPAHAIFILATTEKHKIIPTILSRCQIFDFNRIRVEDSVEYLKYVASQENISVDDESLNLIARKADGGMRDALSMFDKAVSFCGNELFFKDVARTLNVLDYDAYFALVNVVLAGDYPAALTAFDEILQKGFSGQVFMAGLESHLRELLMCKSPQTLTLLEVTGSLLERYKEQAARCEVEFLFGAISLLTEIEGSMRTALNQRLNVELGLMKLCNMAQKKKPDLNEDFPALPELIRGSASTPSASVASANVTPAAQDSDPQAERTEKQPAKASSSDNLSPEANATTLDVVAPAQQPAARQDQLASEEAAGDETEPETKTGTQSIERDVTARRVAAGLPESFSGNSISSILNAPMRPRGTTQAAAKEVQVQQIDPEAEKKIAHFASKFIKSLRAERPRIAPAFQDMVVEGSQVTVFAHSQELHDEIMRNRTELLDMLAATAGVTGKLTLVVKIVEMTGFKRPVKAEDRLKFLTDKNPLLTELRRKLDFELE